jgi:hypothetical protein
METTLHRQLKELYSGETAAQEVQLVGFRIDAIVDGELIEIQQASLGALRDKLKILLKSYRVRVVKPLALNKTIVRRARVKGKVVSVRKSPKHEGVYNMFLDLVHFVGVFPHKRLTLEIVLTDQEEHRVSRPRRRFRGPDFRVLDRKLVALVERHEFRSAADLASLLPAGLPGEFTTADIAARAAIPRWLAQKMAYCLCQIGALDRLGKQQRSWLYRLNESHRRAA